MKKNIYTVLCLVLALFATSCNNNDSITIKTDGPVELKDINDSLSWALGFTLAQNAASTGLQINKELMLQAIATTLESKRQPMTQEQTMNLLAELEQQAFIKQRRDYENNMKDVNERETAYFKKLTEENPNVKKSDKGFYYEVLKEGNGPKGKYGQVVLFDYKGMLTNGQVVDQTYGNREPIRHVLSESIFPGLLEGFYMMNAGSIYRFYFPTELAFGAQGTDVIPPYSTIIYEVELHEVSD